jgi:Rha family phage regulatory protein
MQDIQLFRSLVSNQNGTPITTSNKIATAFGKQHKSVLRAIENLDCSSEFRQRSYAPAEYIDEQGKPRPSFNMTRDGAIFLIMSFKGERFRAWRVLQERICIGG